MPDSSLIGRRRLLAALIRQVAHGRRVCVLTGAAGVGKSRLASALADRLERPVHRVPAAEVECEDGFFEAVSAALDVPLDSARPSHARPRLGEALAAAGRVVVLLDGVHGVAAEAAAALEAWSKAAPDAVFIATSRVALTGVDGATAVGPLDPADAERLFVLRARRRVPDFARSTAEAAAVADAITPLEGSPLAIELAAPWVQVYAVGELGVALRAALLTHVGAPGSPLDTALGWTWHRLDAPTRRTASHCALFGASFTLAALQQVAGCAVAPALRTLREHSLVHEVERGDDTAPRRFRMPPVIRAWSLARCGAGALDAARVAHARWLAGQARVSIDSILWANAAIGAVPAHDLADLRAAVRHPDALPDDLVVALSVRAHRALLDWGPADLHRRIIDDALDRAGPAGRATRVLWLARGQAWWSSDGDEARRSFERAEALGLESGDDEVVLSAIIWLSHAAGLRGDRSIAEALAKRAERMAVGRSPRIIAEVLHHVAMDHLIQRRFDAADGTLRTALAHARLAGAPGLEYVVRMNLGFLHGERGAFEDALGHRSAALALLDGLPSPRNRPDAVLGCGHMLLQLGRLDAAERTLAAAIEHHGRQGNGRGRSRAVGRLGQVRIEQDRLADAALRCLEAERGLRAVGEARGEGLFRAMRGVALLLDGVPGAAAELIESGAAQLTCGGEAQRAGWLHRIGRLARARAGMPDGDPSGSDPPDGDPSVGEPAAWLQPAMARLGAALALFDPADGASRTRAARLLGADDVDRSFEGRISQRLLSIAFDSADAAAHPGVAPRLHIARDGRWFRLDDGPVVDVSRRTHPRRLLAALAAIRRRAPGRRLDRGALFEAGWPGEVALPLAIGQRVHTAIYTLRRSGLASVIEHDRSGWRLSPTVRLIVGGAEAVDGGHGPG